VLREKGRKGREGRREKKGGGKKRGEERVERRTFLA